MRVFLPRSAARHAAARRPGGRAGRRPGQPGRAARCRRRISASATRPLPRVSIFMSVFDCHVNRSPVSRADRADRLSQGPVPQRRPRQGERGQRAQLPSSSRPRAGASAWCRSPGLIARRIVPFVNEGQTVAAGERIGMIRFGSRVDVYLPEGVTPLVAEGQTAHRRRNRDRRLFGPEPRPHLQGRLMVNAARNRGVAVPRREPLYWRHETFAAEPRPFGGPAPALARHPGALAAAQHDHAAGALRRASPASGSPSRASSNWRSAAIVFAAALDGIDGRLARLMKGQSKFGAELDSLADFMNFGCAPGAVPLSLGTVRARQRRLDRGAWCSRSARRCGSRASMS